MSHDQDADGLTASHTPRTRKPGPQAHAGSLERPSLFAGMEDDDVDDVDADRVRLLSTLSSRVGGKADRGRRDAGRAGRVRRHGRAGSGAALWASPWWSRSLFAAMALGAIAVLYSFVQVVRQPHAMSARALVATHAPIASNANATAATAATDLNALDPTAAGADIDPAHARTAATASAEAPSAASFQDVAAMASARIEVMAPPVVAPTSPATAPTPGPTLAALAAPAAEPPLASPTSAGPTVQTVHPTHAALVARAAADAARLNAPASSVTQPSTHPNTAREASTRTRANEDVALLEAMMKHASARRAPPSSAEALQACAALQGADAAVCKAKACVQHPTAAQCHSDAP